MRLQRGVKSFLLGCALAWLSVAGALASPYHGQVTFNGLPLPGSVVTVTATQGDKKVVAVSDDQGLFGFADLADGNWSLDIEMTGFAPLKAQIAVAADLPVATFEMKLMTLDEMRSAAKPVKVDATAPKQSLNGAPATTADPPKQSLNGAPAAASPPKQSLNGAPAEPAQDAASAQANDGFLINGSVNNAATSQFSLNQAFGNNRNGGRWKYNGGLSLVLVDSALNARTFSLNGEQTPKQPYTNIIAGAQVGGPLQIPHLIPLAKAPYFYAGYQRTENKTDSVATVRMPTQAQQMGDLTGEGSVYDPNAAPNTLFGATNCLPALYALYTAGAPGLSGSAPTACIPASEISSVAGANWVSGRPTQGLLQYYPFPNSPAGATQLNYQVPLATDVHTDSFSGRLQKQFGNKNNVNGNFYVSSTRQSTPSVFGFLDTSRSLSTGVNLGWYHRFTQRLSMNLGYNFSISKNSNFGYFAKIGDNVSGDVHIGGNDQAPAYYGPPSLSFTSSQFATLSDGTNSNSRPETNSISYYMTWNRFRHNMTFGGDFRRQEFNSFSESNPKGSLTFTGAATQTLPPCPPGTTPCPGPTGGNDFADFLLGRPDTSSIAYGNADKYLRQSVYDLYGDDDFRVNPELSIRAGLRWEFGAPVTELKNRLANLDVAPNFTAVAPVVATDPNGSVSGNTYPTSLVHPDYSFPEPRVGIAWRPISGSSLLVRAGYGIYNDTSVYRATALAMAQQHGTTQTPLSTSQSVSNSAACPFTIAAPFVLPCATTTADTFAVDPNFKVGYAQQWQLSVQRDLPLSLQMVATYTGIKGTRGVQEILPNSYAPGLTASPYGSAPHGYYWRDSNGNSTREAGMFQLRRRLRNGFTANLTYTYSKSLDDDLSLGGQGPVVTNGGSQEVAQDWTNPAGNRGLSTFDQRNVLAASLQYTTGMGIGGRTLMSGWRGLIYKEWTVQVNINEASGTPETPLAPGVVNGTGFSNIIRANYVGGAIHQLGPNGRFLNPNAFVAPTSGWGTARRDSITGPSQFGLNASLDRTWRLHDRYNVEARVDANNVLNHVAYSGWNTTVGQSLFGTPTGANGMRSLTITLRGRF